jgi:hypothetical protein
LRHCGHPQLVNALVSGLRARAWPEDELKRLRLFEPSEDVEAERIATRRQLVAAVPDEAKALLYRVSLMIGRFDRPIVLSLAELQPSIVAPGQQLDLLIGPRIEPYVRQQFRVSPLVANAGEETLSLANQISVHRAVAEAYLHLPLSACPCRHAGAIDRPRCSFQRRRHASAAC